MMFFLIDELETLISAKKNSRGWDSEHGVGYWTIRGRIGSYAMAEVQRTKEVK